MPGTAGRKARLQADVCASPPARSLHLAPARESGLERCFHTDSSREFMDLDCTQQGILFSDERKNIQQPVFALGVLDTLPCFGIRHMRVVGVELLSAGQNAPLLPSFSLLSSLVPGQGAGSEGLVRPVPWPRRKDPWHPSEATPRVLLLRGAPAALPRSGLRCGGCAGLRGAGARVGPADSVPSRILY